MSMVKINWRPGRKELIRFGIVVTIGLVLIGLVVQLLFDNPGGAIAAYAAAGLLGLPALTGTKIALLGYWLWMGIAFILGNILSRVLLTLIFLFLFTPLGWVRRAFGADRLCLHRHSENSYWRDAPNAGENSTDYERLF